MGVPAFFRWLTVRYPKVVQDALTDDEINDLFSEYNDLNQGLEEDALAEATRLNLASKSRKTECTNPSIENLYLDMNGIIHPCAHPQNGGAQPRSEQEIFDNIYTYTDKVIRIVKPTKLIYFAIDGVAPRAKMNQQRARRFRAARDAEEDGLRKASIKAEWAGKIDFAEEKSENEFRFDSNVITPGTEFMHRLSIALKSYLVQRAQSDPLWKDLVLIFSDAFVPGEGEHKILDFIRSQRAQTGYDPNKRHCIYGADADLIMLGLSTHEAHFFVLREAFMQVNDKTCYKCKEKGHMSFECGTQQKAKAVVEFQFVKIAVVREYLQLEFKDIEHSVAKYDFERVVDDFVFLCFLVGNDFLPHLPSLQIREGALDAILLIYKNLLPKLGGFLTDQGKIIYANADLIFKDIATLEEEQFKQNYYRAQRQKGFQNDRRNNNPNNLGFQNGLQNDTQNNNANNLGFSADATHDQTKPKSFLNEQLQNTVSRTDLSQAEKAKVAAELLKQEAKRIADAKNTQKVDAYVDRVQLGVDGWKMRYYTNKFLVTDPKDVTDFVSRIRQSYIEGLAWVFAYYYKGCESWDWYYPYHYAPFASDLVDCGSLQFTFKMGQPRRPFEQLMCVFPKQSAHALPKCYHWLMSESKSPIIDFYPTSFRLDVNGAAYAWMGVNLLPFICTERLFKAMRLADKDQAGLTDEERERNKLSGDIYIFYRKGFESAMRRTALASGCQYRADFETKDEVAGAITAVSQTFVAPESLIACLSFEHPTYASHSTQLLKNATLPKREVEEHEIYQIERRFFQGETAMKMVEKLLGIPSQFNPYPKYGYKNNHATFEEPLHQSGAYLGKRFHEDNRHYEPQQQRQRTDQQYYNQNRQEIQRQDQRPTYQPRDQYQQHNQYQQQLQSSGHRPQHPYEMYYYTPFGGPAAYNQPSRYDQYQQHPFQQQNHTFPPQHQQWSLESTIQQSHRPAPPQTRPPRPSNNRFSGM